MSVCINILMFIYLHHCLVCTDIVGGHLIGVDDGPEMQACVTELTSFCRKQCVASVARIGIEDVTEDSS